MYALLLTYRGFLYDNLWQIFAALEALFFIIYCFSCAKPLYLLKDKINSIREQVRTVAPHSAQGKTQMDEIMSQDAELAQLWHDYSKTLTPVGNNNQSVYYSTVDAGDYFNVGNVVARINVDFWQNLGSIFTGLGILGTFFGVILGLMGVDLTSDNLTVLKDAIKNLLSGITVAFATSIVGIIAAVIFNIVHKCGFFNPLSNSILALANDLNKKYPHKSTEMWLSDIMTVNNQQITCLNALSGQFATEIGEALDRRLSDGVERVVEGLNPTIEQVDNTLLVLNGTIMELRASGVKTIGEAISASIGSELKAFATTLTDLQQKMEQGTDNMLTQQQEKFAAMLAQLQAMVASLKNEVEVACQKQTKLLTDTCTTVDAKLTQVSANLEEGSTKVAKAFTDASSSFATVIGKTESDTKVAMEEITKNLQENSETINKNLQAQTATLTNTCNAVDAKLTSLGGKIEQYGTTVAATIEIAGENFASTVGNVLKEAGETQQAIINEFQVKLQEVSSMLEEHKQVVDSMCNNYKATTQEGENHLTKVQDAVQTLTSAADVYKECVVAVQVASDKLGAIYTQASERMEETQNLIQKLDRVSTSNTRIVAQLKKMQIDTATSNAVWEQAMDTLSSNLQEFERLIVQAETVYSKQKEVDKLDAEQCYKKGVLCMDAQEYAEAIELFDKVLTFEPSNTLAQHYRKVASENLFGKW